MDSALKEQEIPLQITFHELESSDAIETFVHERTQKLLHFYDRITACRVVIESPHRHSNKERKLFHIRVELGVPGQELVVSHEPGEHEKHEDIHTAIRDAFGAMERQLKEFARKQRGEVKTRPAEV